MNMLFLKHLRFFRFAWLVGVIGLLVQIPLHAAITIESWTTENGIRVFFVETHAIPVLDISVDFDAGTRRDPKGKAGLASLTNMMLARGVAASSQPLKEPVLTEAQISDVFADTGAQRSGSAGMDRAGMVLRTLSSRQEADRAVRVLARLLAQPDFPAEILQREKKRAISAVRESLTQPDTIASRAFMKALYGTHPYAFNPTPESLGSLTREDLQAFHRQHYAADTAVITIVGDASRARAEEIAQELGVRLRRLPAGKKPASLPEVPPVVASEIFIEHPATQSHILIGMPALKRGDPDFFALMVGNYVLGGGGFVSRLMQEVRVKRGLSYGVSSQFDSRLQKGPFIISLQTKKEQTKEAVKVVRDTFNTFMQNGPTEQELKAAQDNLVEGFPLRMDNNAKMLALVSMIGYYGLPLDYLNSWVDRVKAVTASDVREAFARKLSADKLSTIIVGESK
ncbi:MAG: insulinase family protein [Betaproteobacteria bacterium]|nr:insulinase family protein [Betaproteobacteria bacterium]